MPLSVVSGKTYSLGKKNMSLIASIVRKEGKGRRGKGRHINILHINVLIIVVRN